MPTNQKRDRIAIAILALGGQGGGVLANWILEVASAHGYAAQGTSVPGVAQRTGATVYYVELFPADGAAEREPILALMPVPGDVDIVLASELMEAGRAVLRGFITSDRTTLIGSTHRVYSIGEKSALADGRASSGRIMQAAMERSKRFIAFDMDEIASRTGSVISAVMFGALAASGALPFAREAFEQAIRSGGKAVDANLRAFAAAFDASFAATDVAAASTLAPLPTTAAGRALLQRIQIELPEEARAFAIEGVRRLCDYQDQAYASLYLDRLADVRASDTGADGWRLTRETARYLALWMSYEDTIRVADLKVRATRFDRVRSEVRAAAAQPVIVTEYMHPRLQEVCETLPEWLGRRILESSRLSGLLDRLFRKGRHVRTSSPRWFLVLNLLAGCRRWRRGTLRYREEQQRIASWLKLVCATAATDPAAAAELVECQRLIKGYSDTFERGLDNFNRVVGLWEVIKTRTDAAATVKRLREAALADDESKTLDDAVAALSLTS